MSQLPIYTFKTKIIESLTTGNRLIIRAPTGSGKSTQVPQMLYDSGLCNGMILILQPRRIAARMLATRIASERSTELGREVGFNTRFESAVSDETRILFITEGILPRMLLKDADLHNIGAIIFDEFHERSITTDLGLALIRNLQAQRHDLRLIVMSATLDCGPLREYLPDAAVIDSPGRMFSIDLRYTAAPRTTPAWDLAAQAAKDLILSGADGDILIFMPGVYEIRKTLQAIDNSVRGESVTTVPLYGDLPAVRQQEVMELSNRRKIIVATNIAETSLTIPGVRHVIDSGLARVNRYDSARGFNTLYIEPISKDATDQRAGRAGREAPGICIRLWSKSQHDGRQDQTTPEVLRIDLSEALLTLIMLGYNNICSFPWFTPPQQAALTAAIDLLQLLGALTPKCELTESGYQMCQLPMHPRLSRLLLAAGARHAARLAAFAAAVLTERSVVNGKPDNPDDTLTAPIASDLYALSVLFEKARKQSFDQQICTRYAINHSAARAVERTQALYIDQCRRLGIPLHDSHDAVEGLAESMLLAYPDRLAVRRDKGTLICNLRNDRRGELDSVSMVRKARMFIAADIRETRHSAGQVLKPVLSMATEIREEWLEKHFSEQFVKSSELRWNPATQAVEAVSRRLCLDVLIEEKVSENINISEAAHLLAETIITKKLPLTGWNQTVDDWINRVDWLRGLFPEKGLPQFTDDERSLVIYALCEGYYRYSQVKDLPVLHIVLELVNPADRVFIETMAPQTVILPSGRKMRIEYIAGKPPHGRIRIQDLYGQNETPVIAGGRARLTIELLAPNNRPVQITDDLRSFWAIHYPEIKKTFIRRYPKHEWR